MEPSAPIAFKVKAVPLLFLSGALILFSRMPCAGEPCLAQQMKSGSWTGDFFILMNIRIQNESVRSRISQMGRHALPIEMTRPMGKLLEIANVPLENVRRFQR